MKYRLYTTSHKAWDGMFKAIGLATKTIYLEMYILLDDVKATHDFLGLLQEKARAGLEIVIIADAYGSSTLSQKKIEDLRTSGIEFFYFSSLFRRTHRKLLIIDQNIAFLGGVNINEKIRGWHDLQIKISGRVVKSLLRSFAYIYKIVGGKKENILAYSRIPLKQKVKALILDSFSTKSSKRKLNDHYLKVIFEAKESIKIVSPYLLPPRRLLAALHSAISRGVKVKIIIPQDTDIKILNKVNYLNAYRLSAFGVKIYLSKEMNHAKVLLIDDNKGLIGSQNLDILSFNFNIEAGVFFEQKQLVLDLKKVIDKWIQEADLFNKEMSKPSFTEKALIYILKIFYPIFF